VTANENCPANECEVCNQENDMRPCCF